MALDDKTIPKDAQVNDELAEGIRKRLEGGELACASAFAVAAEKSVTPMEVGGAADMLRVRLTSCQLGVFGYPGHTKGWIRAGAADRPVPEGLEDALSQAAGKAGRLSCAAAWAVADRFGISRLQVGYLADRMGIRLFRCQLGAF